MVLDEIFHQNEQKMDGAVESIDHDLKSLRTGRATTATVDAVMVEAYGTPTPINQLATISTPDASTIMIQPWDAGNLAKIEKALSAANLGMTPNNDGKQIRMNVPVLTEETRKDMVKKAHAIAEQGRVAVRNIRRHLNDEIKKTEKHHDISEDDRDKFLRKAQDKTNEHTKKIDELMAAKEKEIMQI